MPVLCLVNLDRDNCERAWGRGIHNIVIFISSELDYCDGLLYGLPSSFQVQVQVQVISHIQIKKLLTMITKVKAAHGEEAHKETTGFIYYEPPQYR